MCPVCDARIDVPTSRAAANATSAPAAPTVPAAQPSTPRAELEAASRTLAKSRPELPTTSESPSETEPASLDVQPPKVPRTRTRTSTSTPTRKSDEQQPAPIEQPAQVLAPDLQHYQKDSFPEFAVNEEFTWPHQMSGELDRNTAYNVLPLAIASILVAVFCLSPSIAEQNLARQFGLRAPDAWSYVVILLATIQIAISIYAIRIPDWSTVWLLTISATSIAAIYAAGLALTMFASNDHTLVRQLGLLDEAVRYRAQPWCFFVLCVALILAYACGRLSVRWYQADMLFAGTR